MAEELQQKVEVAERDFVNFVGDNADKYLRKFKKFNVDGVDKFEWTWHWPAFFFGFWWLLYRKVYVWRVIGFFAAIIALIMPYWFFVSSFVYALIANYIYYKHAKKQIIKYKKAEAPVDPHEAAIALRERGGVKEWVPALAAPTILITLLPIVLVSFFVRTHEPYKVSPEAVLRNAAICQEAYFVDHQTYADSLDKILGPEYGLYLRDGVTLVVLKADSDSYEMTSYLEGGKKRYTLVGPEGEIQETDRYD
jgi:hypothetical protein